MHYSRLPRNLGVPGDKTDATCANSATTSSSDSALWPEHLNYAVAMSFPPNCETAPAVTICTAPFDDLSEFRPASFDEMLLASPRHAVS
jgi:hypothetical protein